MRPDAPVPPEASRALEPMDAFFEARITGYDAHMLNDVPGCREGYARMAALLPHGIETLLDLGCGTGLELDAIFPLHPSLRVTGIDLTRAMLDKLREKHTGKQLELIHGSYFSVPFGSERFDAAVSFETMHHFTPEAKLSLYTRLQAALKPGGCYIECDYMVLDQVESDRYFAENRRLRAQMGIADGAFYHYDTPCTVETQLRLLREAGFRSVELVWHAENTNMLMAIK